MPAPQPPYRILLDGSDITSRVDAGSVSVETRESESGLMDCTIRMAPGTQDPDGHLYGVLALDIDTTGTGWVRVFSGTLIGSEPNDKAHTYKLRASTRMQERFRALGSQVAVLTALSGCVWHQSVFGDAPDDLWEFAQQCMQTAPIDWHIKQSDGSLEGVDWSAKATADHSLTSADIGLREDMAREMAKVDDMVNTVILQFDYEFTRKKIREHTLSLDFLGQLDMTPCEWFRGITPPYYAVQLPWSGELSSVMLNGSWSVPLGLQYTTPIKATANSDDEWTAKVAPCGGDGYMDGAAYYKVTESDRPVFSASATGYVAHGCPIIERYEMTLSANAHIAATGTTTTARYTGSHTVPAPDGWPTPSPGNFGWPADTAGDGCHDADDEISRLAMLGTALARGRTAILSGLRGSSLRCTTRIRPDITLADSVSVACWGVATGPLKVRAIRHTFRINGDSLDMRTTLELAVSRGFGGTADALTIPEQPDTSNPVAYWSDPSRDGSYTIADDRTDLPVYVGSRTIADDAPDPDERIGLVTNSDNYPGFNPSTHPNKVYARAIRVKWPEIEARASAAIDETVTATYEVAVPHDPISVTAP